MRSRFGAAALGAAMGALLTFGCLSYSDALPGQAVAAVAPAVGPGSFQPLNPARVFSTLSSPALKLGPGKEITVTMPATVPADATAVSLGITAALGTASTGHLTLYPTGTSRPGTSDVEYAAGRIANSPATVKLGANRKVTIFNSAGMVDVIVDLHGYYLPPTSGPAGYVGRAFVSAGGSVDRFRTSNGIKPEASRPSTGSYFVTFKGVPGALDDIDIEFDVIAFFVSCSRIKQPSESGSVKILVSCQGQTAAGETQGRNVDFTVRIAA
ncbi:hypothetical protein [Kribbella sp. NPDC055071]